MPELADDIDLSVIKGFYTGLAPDAVMSVAEWADQKRILPETSAEPGKFRTSRTPYAREIMEKLSVSDPAQKIVMKKGSQVGATEIGNNWVGYSIDVAPAPFLYIMPTDTMMKKTSKQRIEKMIESTPELRAKVSRSKGKDSGNTLMYKEFPGGFLSMVGANSPVGLSSTPAKNIYGDEIDRYPESVGGEGSAVDLAETRTATFGNRRKMLLTSTPTKKGASQIDNEFEKTGQRYFHVPCPHCNAYQVLVIEQLRYEVGKYQAVTYECLECNKTIEERHKTRMLNAGKWVAKYPEKEDGYTFGYHLSAMYSPYGMYSWGRMAKDYEESKNDIPKKIVFINTKLGECYEADQGDKPDWEALYERAEKYDLNRPFSSVTIITAGVDVQADRLEIEIVGWMKGKRSQQIDYRVLYGDTAQSAVWDDLEKILNETWIRDGDKAVLPLRLMAVDTGYNTEKVYSFTRKHSISRVIPIKGRENLDTYVAAPKAVDIVKAGKKIGKVKVWGIGVSMIKSELYGFLKSKIDLETGEIPDGYCHFPHRDTNYFRGITAEEIILTKNKRGYDVVVWMKKYKRNEPLDCRVYARAAAYVLGMDRWTDSRWAQEQYAYVPERDEAVPVAPSPKNQVPAKKKSKFWGNS